MNRDDEDKKKEEIRLKRKSNSLRKIVLEARQRWEESIKKNILFCYIDKGESERSPQKTIYFIRPGINWNKVKKEREKLEARIARTDKRVLGSSRSLWLPTVIENAEKITISIYDAASTKNISLDKGNLIININETKVHIAQKESEVLEYLIQNKNKIVSIDELSTNVWAYEESPTASTIRTYIKNLRKIVGDESIINIRGVGYRFNC